ncbi:hypothetical protein THIAE_07380 [Thiomicrospira aerophila AL3]|uniref:Flagellar hook-associated protein 1 n=1 Tax=Thiomicrospira aerophila AL3 TaxID=717772 RepID=W0DV65_9GAMM|nr:flagellar hook-associated protein FlgK [Thiomicrospira aerophila]AHF02332.1 hypothetical protein THIAE_07380 [Thiomicrospira aerophila AL3]
MADMLTIATSATTAFNRALQVTSHNIANVNTEGYNRQRVEFEATSAGSLVSRFNGTGTFSKQVERMYDEFLFQQLTSSNSEVKGFETRLGLANQIEGALGSVDLGMQSALLGYFDALQGLATNPESTIFKGQALDQANTLVATVNSAQQVLAQTEAQINNQMSQLATDINERLVQLREVNFGIKTASTSGMQEPNDLFDKRDQLTYELSELVGIRTKINTDGTVEVFSANNRIPLLADNKVIPLQVQSDNYPGRERNEVFVTLNGQTTQVSDLLRGGGELGGLLEVRDNLLDKTYERLGMVLNGFVAAQNVQNQQGWDAAGNPGEAIFTPLSFNAFAQQGNSATSSVTVELALPSFDPTDPTLTYGDKQQVLADSFTAIGQLKPASYQIDFDGTDLRITNLTTREVQLTAFNPATDDFVDFQGLRFNVDNVAPGDRFQVSPHRGMIEQFGINLSTPDQLATRGQNPLQLDPSDLATPAAVGDNLNVANLAALQNKKLLNSVGGQPTMSILQGYAQVTTDIGRYVNRSESLFQSTSTAFDFLLQKRESVSGVNLDEEAANLLRFQQAYQAAAQVIQTSQSLFQTLLGAVRS